jgi:small subunit ribosomal protein S2
MDKKEEKISKIDDKDLEKQMSEAGVFFGHDVSKLHPKMKPNVAGIKNMVYIIDSKKTIEGLNNAIKFLNNLLKEDKKVLVVGTRVHIKELAEDLAIAGGFFLVKHRWLGGTFTNFPELLKRINYLKDLEKKREEGYYEKYTKKEKMEIDRKINELNEKFGGIKEMTKIPDTIIVLDAKKDEIAIDEAKKRGIPVISIVDTDQDPTPIDYPIPANNDAYSSVKFIVEQIKNGINK